MNIDLHPLREWSVNSQVQLLFVALFGLLVVASVAVVLYTLREANAARRERNERMQRDLRAVWIGSLVFWLAWISGPLGATLAFGIFSFLALREFITLVRTRRGDHRSLILAFFVALPLQYVLVGLRAPSRLMVDKITTVPKSKVGAPIGRLDPADIIRLNQALLVFLGMATAPNPRRRP